MRKKGLELSINFIVMLIFAVVVFSFGLVFAARMLSTGNQVVKGLPKVEEAILDSCIKEGHPICMPKSRKEIAAGKSDVFGLAILNTLGDTKEFKVFVEFSTAVDEQNNIIPPASINAGDWTFPDYGPFNIENNMEEKIPIAISVPVGAKPGEYVFNVNVCYDDGDAATSTPAKCPGTYPDIYSTTYKLRVAAN